MSITILDYEIEMITITCATIMNAHGKHNFFRFRSHKCKLGEPAESIFLTPTLLIGGSVGNAGILYDHQINDLIKLYLIF